MLSLIIIPLGLMLLGLGLYFKKRRFFYSITIYIYIILNLLLIANVEFPTLESLRSFICKYHLASSVRQQD